MMDNEKDKILKDVKLKISISNFKKEERIEMNKMKSSILKIGIVASCIIVGITGVVFAKDVENFIKNMFGGNSSEGVDTAVNNGYIAEIKTEYQKADGIEISVDSLLMDDFNFDMNFKIKFNENNNIETFGHIDIENLKILDETGKIVFNTHTAKYETEEKMREEAYKGAYSFLIRKKNDNEFMLSLSATGSPEAFPKSKHLIISFSKISMQSLGEEKSVIYEYEGNWKFNVDVPEEFYNRKTQIYKAKKCTDKNINLNEIQATLSNTAFKIYIPVIETDKVDYELLHSNTPKSIFDKIALQKEYVETSNGKRFETAQRSDGDGGYGVPAGENKIIDYHQTFNLTTYDTTKELILHIFTNKGEEIRIYLEKE